MHYPFNISAKPCYYLSGITVYNFKTVNLIFYI